MAAVDSLLSLAHREGADEVRLGTDRAPAMFASGAPKRLSMPKTPDDMLRHLLGAILSSEVEARLKESGKADAVHELSGVGAYRVALSRRGDGGFDAVFTLSGKPGPAVAQAPRPAPASPPAASSAVSPPLPLSPAPLLPPSVSVSTPAPSLPLPELSGDPSEDLLSLLVRAHLAGASDLHLATGEPPTVRVHGALTTWVEDGPVDVVSLLGGLHGERAHACLAAGRSFDFVVTLPEEPLGPRGRAPRVRGNVYRASTGLVAALRLLPPEAPSLEALAHGGLLSELALLPNGLVLVVGPTGSGKSTTLAALAREILRRRSVVLVTLEDPIEYVLGAGRGRSIVRQRQVGRDVADFAVGLRDALREDPDVILVGEMRDLESISLALTAAETGHLVLATLHSRSAASAIERIVDTYPSERQAQIRGQLADSLRAVVAQRLLPRARGEGRVLALEVLRVTSSVASGLREGKIGTVVSAMQSGRRDGMVTLERSLADLVRRGDVHADEAKAVANDVTALQSYREGAG